MASDRSMTIYIWSDPRRELVVSTVLSRFNKNWAVWLITGAGLYNEVAAVLCRSNELLPKENGPI